MGLNKVANTEDVQKRSSLTGYGGSLHFKQPSWLQKSTSGDSTATFSNSGMQMKLGSNTGDTITVEGMKAQPLRKTKITTEFLVDVTNGTPTSNTFKIGYLQLEGSYQSGFLDLKNEELVYSRSATGDRNAKPIPSLGANESVYLKVVWYSGGPAELELKTESTTTTASFPARTISNANQFVFAKNDGGTTGDIEVIVPWMQHSFEIEQ